MEDNFTLDIHLDKPYTFKVEVYYRSVQVLRFHLVAPDLELKLEKRLLTKTQPWKLLESSIKLDMAQSANYFNTITFYLNEEIKGPKNQEYQRWQQPYSHGSPVQVPPEKPKE